MTRGTLSITQEDQSANSLRAELQSLLGRQAAALRARYLLHGAALTLLLVGAAIALCFALDHVLRLPKAIRLLHVGLTLLVATWGAVRFLAYPLTRPLPALEIAVLLERCFPVLHQRLVSSLQLLETSGAALRGQSAAMVAALRRDTQLALANLPVNTLFDARATARYGGLAAGLVLILVTGAILHPATAIAFALRHCGFDNDYPRQTYLALELPDSSKELQRHDQAGESTLLLPLGSDLHVAVQVTGVAPANVQLVILPATDQAASEASSSTSVLMTPRQSDRFRHVFRRIAADFSFHAAGGDDARGDRLVHVRTVRPPQVATLASKVTPPAYLQQAPSEQLGGAIEGLLGSAVRVQITTTEPVSSATVHFLEGGHDLPLAPVSVQDDSGVANAYFGDFLLERSDRYEVRLLSTTGLLNPKAGNYPISALQDHAPIGHWLLPEDENLLLLPNALLVLRWQARDDFGLGKQQLRIDHAGTTQANREQLLPGKECLAHAFLPVQELLQAKGPTGNDGLAITLLLDDNKAPQANQTELPRRLVQIVDGPQLAAAISKAFRTLREDAEQALAIQLDRKDRLQELLAGVDQAQRSPLLTGVQVGQARVQSACQRLHLGLMRAFDQHLCNQLEPSPNGALALQRYCDFLRDSNRPLAHDPEYYRSLAASRRSGVLGPMETTLDPILAMVTIADELAEQHGPAAQRWLAQAEVAREGEAKGHLAQAGQEQDRIIERFQQLLLRLQEWNDFQDLIQEARALRDRQRDLQARTQEAKDK